MEKDDQRRRQPEAAFASGVIEPKPETSIEKLRDPEASSRLKNWDCRESSSEFHVEKDKQGRTASIEGWLQHRQGKRPDADGKLQQEFRKSHGLDKSQDAFHVIAYQHGGPTAELNTAERVKDNLIAADSTINRSHHAMMEKQISEALARGEQIYCKATISYGSDTSQNAVPRFATYAYFVKAQSGEPQDYVIKEYKVRVDQTPGLVAREGDPRVKEGVKLTAAEVLKRENAKNFYEDEWRGQNPDRPN